MVVDSQWSGRGGGGLRAGLHDGPMGLPGRRRWSSGATGPHGPQIDRPGPLGVLLVLQMANELPGGAVGGRTKHTCSAGRRAGEGTVGVRGNQMTVKGRSRGNGNTILRPGLQVINHSLILSLCGGDPKTELQNTRNTILSFHSRFANATTMNCLES